MANEIAIEFFEVTPEEDEEFLAAWAAEGGGALYRAIRDDAFPAVRVRSRYVIPVAALERPAAVAVESGGRVEVAAGTAERRRQ